MPSTSFVLDPRLAADTIDIGKTDRYLLRLVDDARWPWLMLVPSRALFTELHQLEADDLDTVLVASVRAGAALQQATGYGSINTAAIGNVVTQLHLHVVARNPGDPNWPGPVWGHGVRTPRPADEPLPEFVAAVQRALNVQTSTG